MTVAPTFVADMSTLKSNLRLSGVPTGDAMRIIDQAVQASRLLFFDRLGAPRISAIQAFAANENPNTADEYVRARANLCEIWMVRVYLLRTMPVLLRDDRSTGQQSWNEEGLTRDMSQALLAKEIAKIEGEIEEAIIALAAGENDNQTIQAMTMGRIGQNTPPGGDVFNSCGRVA